MALNWTKKTLLALALLSPSGCGFLFDAPESATKAPVTEEVQDRKAFAAALQEEYLDYARRAYDREDFAASDFYAERSILAGEGQLPVLSKLPSAGLETDARSQLEGQRETLEALFAHDVRRRFPQQAATAQVAFDCHLRSALLDGPNLLLCADRAKNAIAAMSQHTSGAAQATAQSADDAATPKPQYEYAGHIDSNGRFIAAPPNANPSSFARAAEAGKVQRKKPAAKPNRQALADIDEVAAAAQPIKGDFVVYFNFGDSSVTEEGMENIKDAIAELRKRGADTLTLYGHADRKGSRRANKIISMRRAQAVRAEIESQGIAGLKIKIVALGEERPAVSTRDGVADALNRRVEIAIN
ncbi:MAG: OmpA family protein [Neomegalonema sp.]|nr:OmpA family protein [Neomegalonema sp.]